MRVLLSVSTQISEFPFTSLNLGRLSFRLEDTLPALAKTKKLDDGNFFLALACAESLGAVLYDTNDEDNGQGTLVVEAVRGVADVASVPIGSCLKYLNSETLPLGLSVDDLGEKVSVSTLGVSAPKLLKWSLFVGQHRSARSRRMKPFSSSGLM